MSKASKISSSFKSGYKRPEKEDGEDSTIDKVSGFFKKMFNKGAKESIGDSVESAKKKKKKWDQDEYNKKYKVDDYRDKSVRRRN